VRSTGTGGWALAVALALGVTQAGPARADDCHPALDLSKPQYIIGYGSLMESASKRMTEPGAGMDHPRFGQAGRNPLDLDEFLRLQRLLIGDARFVHLGLRTEGGYLGQCDRRSGAPIPAHISARHEDLASLVEGIITFTHERS
jgi:hypothetical protein